MAVAKWAAKPKQNTARMVRSNERRKVGLARALSKMGYCSRSLATELVRAGKVRLNGRVRDNPEFPVRLGCDRIEVDGRAATAAKPIYLMMNKPRGVITTTSDEKGRRTVYDSLPRELPRVAPVGRLDKASEGLLLFTNDSEWAARITAPESHLGKTYHVQVKATVAAEDLRFMMRGVRVKTGETLRTKQAEVLRHGERNTWLMIVLDEGKNRQIRRILQQMGMETLRLIRIAIGPLRLGDLAKGAHRELTREEKINLDRAVQSRAKANPRAQSIITARITC